MALDASLFAKRSPSTRSHTWLVLGVEFIAPRGMSRFWKMFVSLARMESGEVVYQYIFPISWVRSKKEGECASLMKALDVENYAAMDGDIKVFEKALNEHISATRPHIRFGFKVVESKSHTDGGRTYTRKIYTFWPDKPEHPVPCTVSGIPEIHLVTIRKLRERG